MLKSIIKKLFKSYSYGRGLERYIIARNPQNNGDVERYAFEYQQTYVRSGLWNILKQFGSFSLRGGRLFMNTRIQNKATILTNWWPYTDEEWKQLNYPERFNKPQKPVDNEDQD